MTGTSINPLLRAANLAQKGFNVTLVLPWLPPEEQHTVFPAGLRFERPVQQEQYVRWWCENKANIPIPSLRLRWYRASYRPILGSIIQHRCDITQVIPKEERDVAILEEPEHLNWYHHGAKWDSEFRHVVGVAHTNYLQYSRYDEGNGVPGWLKEPFAAVMNEVVCKGHTDVVIKLSATLSDVAERNLVCNVHGVRSEFLAIGAAMRTYPKGAYFLGKALYTKGYRELIDNLLEFSNKGGDLAQLEEIDTFGSGPDQEAVREEVLDKGLPLRVNNGIDHAHPSLHEYKVFVNPSTSDVLCTATAEALAMGKKVLIPEHPSNTFFMQFSNTISYKSNDQLVPLLIEALTSDPTPLSPMEQYMLSWEAASERLLDAAAFPAGTSRPGRTAKSYAFYYLHYAMSTQPFFDMIRTVTGAGPVTPWAEQFEQIAKLAKLR